MHHTVRRHQAFGVSVIPFAPWRSVGSLYIDNSGFRADPDPSVQPAASSEPWKLDAGSSRDPCNVERASASLRFRDDLQVKRYGYDLVAVYRNVLRLRLGSARGTLRH